MSTRNFGEQVDRKLRMSVKKEAGSVIEKEIMKEIMVAV